MPCLTGWTHIPNSSLNRRSKTYKLNYVSTRVWRRWRGHIFSSENNFVYVSDVFEGFPAQKADIRPGDQIMLK